MDGDIKLQGQANVGALSGRLTFEQGNNRIVGRDSNNLVRLLISGTENNFSLKVAKAGFDATTATDAQLIFNSNQNVFKIVATGVITFPLTNGASSGSQATQGYDIDTGVAASAPLIAQVFTQTGDAANQLPYIASIPGPTFGGYIAYRFAVNSYLSVVTNTVHIAIESTNFISSVLPALSMRWYILQETAS